MGQNVENYLAQNSNFRRSRGHQFFPKNESYGYGVKSWWGPPRVHLGANGVQLGKKKMGQNRKKITMPQNSNFRLLIDFSEKNGSYGSGAKSRWGPPRVHLGANGSKKWVKTVKITMPQNSNFRLPGGHRFFAKNGSYIYSAKSRSGLPRVHLWANGVPLSPKNGSKRENYHAPKFEFSTTPRSSIFSKKWKLRLWRQITLRTS